jgi:hypothetical protein
MDSSTAPTQCVLTQARRQAFSFAPAARFKMVSVEGFAPPISWFQTKRVTRLRYTLINCYWQDSHGSSIWHCFGGSGSGGTAVGTPNSLSRSSGPITTFVCCMYFSWIMWGSISYLQNWRHLARLDRQAFRPFFPSNYCRCSRASPPLKQQLTQIRRHKMVDATRIARVSRGLQPRVSTCFTKRP